MNRLNQIGRRLLILLRRKQFDADLDEEMRLHRELREREQIERGLSLEEAHYAAQRRFGNDLVLREESHDMWGWNSLETFLQDIRYGLRQLRRSPGFTAVAMLTLALGVGANTAIFSVVNTLLLRPLPFPASHELVWIAPPPKDCGLSCATYSADAYEEFRAQSSVYQDVTGYEAFTTPDNLRITGRGEPEPATSIMVIGNFFQVLGVQPALGRLFTAEEAPPGPHPVALLTNAYWRRQFNADPAIVGKTIDVGGTPDRFTSLTVVGVLPASFDFGAVFSPGAKVDFFTPLNLNWERDWGNIVTLLGRLKPGVTVAQALDDARQIAPGIYQNVKHPETLGQYKGDLIPVPLKDYVTGKLRRSLITLWCAVGAILLIAGVNLSNLLLARAAARAKEFAVRGALGASRGRTVRQLLAESLVLSGAGAAGELGLALILIAWLARQGSLALPLLGTLRIDGQALSWTLLIAAFTTVLFGLVPGLRIAGGNLLEALKDSGPGAGLGRKHERVRATLVVSEVALACVLLVSAGLLLRSFLKVLDVDLGFEPDHAASIQVDYDGGATAAKRGEIFQQILARVTTLPGVEAAGIVDFLPLGPNREWDTPVPQGKTFAPGELPDPLVYVVTPGFIRAMGIRLQGRDFTWADTPQSERAVLINDSAARVYWPGEDAVGKVLMRGKEADRVVGVVDDVHEENVEGPVGAQIYYPVTQQNPDWAQLVVRSSLPPASLAASVLHTLRELNPKQPAAEFRPIRTIVDRANSPRRFFMLLVAAFAGLGLLLAALGIYGVISYSVTRQTQEIGIRMALGATQGHVLLGVLTKTLRLTLLGISLGVVASFVVARLIASLLFGTTPTDPATFASMAALLCAIALMAGYVPARRAARIDPMVALRHE